MGDIGPAGETYKGSSNLSFATASQTLCKSGHVITTIPSSRSTLLNSLNAIETSCANICSIL